MRIPLFVLLVCGLSLFSACGDSETKSGSDQKEFKGGTHFEQLTSSETGIDFINHLREDATTNFNSISFDYYYNGSGVAVGDINNDGKPDIFFAANEGKNSLYLNEGNFKFKDISDEAGINPSNKRWSTGAVMADVNLDGYLDIYVCQSGFKLYPREERANLLFINNGDNTFTEKAKEYGIDNKNESVSAAFFDYDRDGDQDLYVLNESIYVATAYDEIFEEIKDPQKLRNASGTLYRNDDGSFTDVTKEAGVLRLGFGLGLNVNDINKDGWPDIYVSNDYSVPEYMFINNGDGTFTDQLKQKTKQVSHFGMGNDIADFNNDALPDIVVLDMAATDHVRGKTLMQSMNTKRFWYLVDDLEYQHQYMFNSLQLNNGNGTFSNIAAMAGLLRSEWSWASLFADLDNDGWKDCYITNGRARYTVDNDFKIYKNQILREYDGKIPLEMRQEIYNKAPQIKTVNLAYENNKDLTFTEKGKNWNLQDSSYSNGAAYADFDNDGDLDLVVNNINHEAFVYKNLSREKHNSNYLQFEFKGPENNPRGYNTKVYIYYDGQSQYQEFHPTRGYASSVDQMLHFGVGNVDVIDSVIVQWLDGKVQELQDVKANQRLTIDHSNAIEKELPNRQPKDYAFEELSLEQLGIDFAHRENEFNDFEKEVLMPHRQSTLGPAIAVADVNADGYDDFYIGGAHGQSGQLYIQKSDGSFQKTENMPWHNDAASEDMDALFFDVDGDQDLDLYVCSGGGGEMEGLTTELMDRIYLNQSTNTSIQFEKGNQLDPVYNSNNVVRAADFDGDNDLDLFVGGAAQPGRYPFPERSFLYRNDEGNFTDVTEEFAASLMRPGSVKDAVWTDIDDNGTEDLIIVGEWMPVKVMLNDGSGQLSDASEAYGTEDLKGWWYSIAVADFNEDGQKDLVLGNVGKNIKFSASKKKPFNLFAGDFDENGVTDIVLSKEYKGKLVPTRGRECSSDQMPFIKEKFPTYKEFAMAELDDILGEEKLSNALHLQVNTFSSKVLMNRGGRFEAAELPNWAQIAPINSIITEDFNEDGNLDLLIAGNMYNTEVETPRYDAGNGLLLLGDGKGNFDPLLPYESGFSAPKNVKDMAILNASDGSKLVIIANNDDAPQVFKFSKPDLIGMK